MVGNTLKQVRFHEVVDSEPIVVSVLITTYNLETYIKDTIESVLDQIVDFRIEIVISDDCSTDRTTSILEHYQSDYPDIIKLNVNANNIGITPNFIDTHNKCTGKYIALLDGDDLWTDSDKLFRQINFLEKNLNYSGSCHQAMVIYTDGTLEHVFCNKVPQRIQLIDVIGDRLFHTSSLVYRNHIWISTGGIPRTVLISNDRAINILVAINGYINYFEDTMCIYRRTGQGISSNARYVQVVTELEMIPWVKKMGIKFPAKRLESYIHYCIYVNSPDISAYKLLVHYLKYAKLSFSFFPDNVKGLKWGTIFFVRRLKNLIYGAASI
jgi:glycosyltransferase involved in cell wall biosynthesis